ncbi:hypothetical protein FMH07_15995 [Vibrio parahaemolyticus]|nr:hypothetical protein [Vibrio parahaemolyticus]
MVDTKKENRLMTGSLFVFDRGSTLEIIFSSEAKLV